MFGGSGRKSKAAGGTVPYLAPEILNERTYGELR